MKITVYAKPNAKEEKVIKIDETTFSVFVKAPPKEDKANFAIVEALARHFDVSFSCIRFVAGRTSKKKVFEVIR
ncbi:MAG: DUF167 domain-containing protein [bacterium]